MTGGRFRDEEKEKEEREKVKRASRRDGLTEKKRGYRAKEGEEEGSTVSTEKATTFK